MNKKPGQVEVTVQTGYCPFCFRVRNLRHEERHMGTLVRTTITCETCHRTLSSTMGVAGGEPVTQEAGATEAPTETPAAAAVTEAPSPNPSPKAAAKPRATKATTTKPPASRSRAPRSE